MTRQFLLSIFVVLSTTILLSCAEKSSLPEQGKEVTDEIAPVAQLGVIVVPRHYHIELTIDPSQDAFSGQTTIDIDINKALDRFWLHGKDLRVSEVYLTDKDSNRVEATYEERHDSGVSMVILEKQVEAGSAVVHFAYEASFNLAADALFKVDRGAESYALTQFEPIAARKVFPGFDEPVFKVPFDLEIVSRSEDIAVTTTPETTIIEEGNGFVRHTFETTRPLPTYLLAFAVGPYDVVDFGMIPANSIRDREIPLRGIAAKGLGERMQYALSNTEGLLTKLEEYFGSPYPYRKLDLIAVPDSFGGAMENVGAITYDEYLLLMDKKSPVSQRRDFMETHAHELAHQWFGNLVTPSWWTDIWLNEAFATWISYKVAQAHWPEGEFDRQILKGALGAMSNDSLASAREIREPIDHNDKISGAFDGITYQKGGGVLAMLEQYAGKAQFQKGIRYHMDRYADGTAMAEGFMESLVQGSELGEIEPIFQSYISQPGVPLVSIALACEDNQNPRLLVRQTRYAPLGSGIDAGAQQWQIPICIKTVLGGVATSECSLLDKKEREIDLGPSPCPDYVHPNANGRGYYRFSLDEESWSNLLVNSSQLTAAEALVMIDSLDAAFRAGKVSAKTYFNGLATLLNHEAWDVADTVTKYFERITNIVEADQMQVLENALRKVVGPRFEKLENISDTSSDLLQKRLQRFMIVIAKDPTLRKSLASKAAARIGLGGDPDETAAPASQLETIFSVGVQDLGEPFFNLLLERMLASEDPSFRDSAVGALARVEDPVLVKKLQEEVLNGGFRAMEKVGIVFRQMARSATRELTYAWILENSQEVIDMVPESFRSETISVIGSSFCTESGAVEWQRFIASNGDRLPGYERSLAQATESIRLCAALRMNSAADILSAAGDF
ncbi:MAG: hypothetical protein CMQ20_07080 [Gammaproteobacteria bacterium]|jgi:alanyl aminopeptidase|nr:hypothetical protein [Gammaproteobacteria bacterium]|tara:strand:- start:35761 stop:38463 length:2703 start_codon:yes stop_codon:yes gene_type:complete